MVERHMPRGRLEIGFPSYTANRIDGDALIYKEVEHRDSAKACLIQADGV